jgi:hypothetical protein
MNFDRLLCDTEVVADSFVLEPRANSNHHLLFTQGEPGPAVGDFALARRPSVPSEIHG